MLRDGLLNSNGNTAILLRMVLFNVKIYSFAVQIVI